MCYFPLQPQKFTLKFNSEYPAHEETQLYHEPTYEISYKELR
jgi:hypothetical protein